MSVTNPLAQVFHGLWTLLESNASFAALVPSGCRLKTLGSTGNPRKPGAQYADFPSVMIEVKDGISVKDWTNTDGNIKKRFQIKVATGNRQADAALELEWVIFVAMKPWEATLGALTWKGKSGYVKHCGLYEHQETEKERELTRQETGWATVYDGEVWMLFSDADIAVGPG